MILRPFGPLRRKCAAQVSRALKGKSLKKKVEPETLEEHIESGGALMYVRVWHVARVRLRITGAHDVRPADFGISGVCTTNFQDSTD